MLQLGAVTRNFFDRRAVTSALDRGTRKALSRFGSFVRTRARSSIRKRKQPSAPGQPPSSRTGLLRDHIYFAYEPQRKSVVIGPALLARSSNAQKVLEFGGAVQKHKNPRRRIRRIGGAGEIREFGPKSRTTRMLEVGQTGAAARLFGAVKRPVTYAHLYSQAQADRANRINERLFGPELIAGSIAPRPYMKPAFDVELAKGPKEFQNIVR